MTAGSIDRPGTGASAARRAKRGARSCSHCCKERVSTRTTFVMKVSPPRPKMKPRRLGLSFKACKMSRHSWVGFDFAGRRSSASASASFCASEAQEAVPCWLDLDANARRVSPSPADVAGPLCAYLAARHSDSSENRQSTNRGIVRELPPSPVSLIASQRNTAASSRSSSL
eukprot:scaffold213_cov245-Pinguiococcus_pyrenoidosus.AAC.8